MTTHTPTLLGRTSLTKILARGGISFAVATAVFGGLAASGASATAAKPQTLNLLEVDTSFVGTGGFNAHGNSAPTVGQGVLLNGSLYTLNGHKQGPREGLLHTTCTFTNSAGASVCTAVASLTAGTIVVSGVTPANSTKPYTTTILGGSGHYTGAKGHIAIKPIGGSNSNKAVDTIIITS